MSLADCRIYTTLVERFCVAGREVAAEQDASGALLPRHIHEAFQRMGDRSSLAHGHHKRKRRL